MQIIGIWDAYPVRPYATIRKAISAPNYVHGYYCLFSILCKYPIVSFCVSQLAGVGTAFLLYLVIGTQGYSPDQLTIIFAGIAGVSSTLVGARIFKLSWWWFAINLSFPMAIAAAMSLAIDPWVYFICFLILLAVFWNAGSTRVPLYLTNHDTWRILTDLLPSNTPVRFIDLGSGLGGTLHALASCRPDCQFAGVETAPVPYAISRLRQSIWGLPNTQINYGSIWKADLAKFDIVYCFLSTAPMGALFDKARTEMRAGTLFISNSFAVPDQEPDQIITVDDARSTRLLIWNM